MTHPEHDLEQLLRQAPQPTPPAGLRQALLRTAPERGKSAAAMTAGTALARWLNSWKLTLATACVALAALGVVAMQQSELRQLRQQIEELRHQVQSPAAPAAFLESRPAAPASTTALPLTEREDLQRLQAEVAQLQAQKMRLDGLPAENEKLRHELAALTQQAAPEVTEALQDLRAAKERAQRIACVNNLKQLGLAVRLYANDNQDGFPRDVLVMSNELATTRILVCPADTGRQPAAGWSDFTPANTSYEFLAPDGSDTDPQRVLFRCRIHRGSVGLCDGSVQQLSEARQARDLVTRNGKLYLGSADKAGGPE
jgi:cell division protein FtsB